LLLTLFFTLTLIVFNRQWPLKRFLVFVKRLRWFFLSIAILGLWFTPGQALIEGWAWSPTHEGILWSLHRIAVLLLLVFMLSLLLEKLTNEKMMQGLIYLLTPLKPLKVDANIVAIRIGLTLRYVSEEQEKSRPAKQKLGIKLWLVQLSHTLTERILEVENRCQVGVEQVQIPVGLSPRPIQWTLPVLVLGSFLFIRSL